MDLLNKTKELCRIYDIHPARSKGQNFLISEEIYDKIIEAAELKKDDIVLEAGPGLGFLTAKLAEKAGRVAAVELDDKLAKYLKTAVDVQKFNNVEAVNGNVLELGIRNYESGMEFYNKNNHTSYFILHTSKYKVVANLPYNITSVFLRKFLGEAEIKPSLMVLMLQKEVAERNTAKPGKMSLLAVSAQFYAALEIIEYAPKENYWPKPEVDSAIVKIRIKAQVVIARIDSDEAIHNSSREKQPVIDRHGLRSRDDKLEKEFFRLVKIGFSARRKMLKNNLANGFHISQETAEKWLTSAGFKTKIRAQELSVEDWKKLLVAVSKNML